LHSACFSAVVSQRSATISAVNSTCSCQGAEGCGDATPQASSIYIYIYIYIYGRADLLRTDKAADD
jgi:hypothetical protein